MFVGFYNVFMLSGFSSLQITFICVGTAPSVVMFTSFRVCFGFIWIYKAIKLLNYVYIVIRPTLVNKSFFIKIYKHNPEAGAKPQIVQNTI